jgi:hypothetical protein
VAEGVVELEFWVFDELCDPVHFKLVFVHDNFRVAEWNAVNLAILKLSRKDWPFLYADWDLELVRWNVLKRRLNILIAKRLTGRF